MKEESSLEKFDENCHLYKKSRNPCNGELTPRDDAEYLIPFEKIILDKMKTTQYSEGWCCIMHADCKCKSFLGTLVSHETIQFRSTNAGTSRVAKISAQNSQQVEAMKAHKEKIAFELTQMQRAAAYKQYLLQYH